VSEFPDTWWLGVVLSAGQNIILDIPATPGVSQVLTDVMGAVYLGSGAPAFVPNVWCNIDGALAHYLGAGGGGASVTIYPFSWSGKITTPPGSHLQVVMSTLAANTAWIGGCGGYAV
jgi:hypothetical protein